MRGQNAPVFPTQICKGVVDRASKERFDADPEFKARARAAVTRLQAGDPDFIRAWQLLCDISRKDFEAIYSRLDIRIQERGESYYNPMLQARPSRSLSVDALLAPIGATTVMHRRWR